MTSSRLGWVLAALVVGAAAAWLSVLDVSAHAAYESSTPAFAAVLGEPPERISIRFSQELFRREGANEISVLHVDSGDAVDVGQAVIGNAERRLMVVELGEPLAAGRYLVFWRNLSAEDGDEDSGVYPFYVGRGATAAEAADDRRLAGELLIAYPGDEQQNAEAEPTAAPSGPAVVRADDARDAALGVGPILFLGVGIAAGFVLIGALGYRIGARRRGG